VVLKENEDDVTNQLFLKLLTDIVREAGIVPVMVTWRVLPERVHDVERPVVGLEQTKPD